MVTRNRLGIICVVGLVLERFLIVLVLFVLFLVVVIIVVLGSRDGAGIVGVTSGSLEGTYRGAS